MKRIISLCLITAVLAAVLTACGGELDVDRNTVYVQKKGGIVEATVEPFEKGYYDQAELESYVKERVAAYALEHEEKSVEMDKFEVADGIATLYIKYAGYADYAEFNGVKMFAGTVPQARAAGYDFDTEFLAVEDGVLGDTVDSGIVLADDTYKAVILSTKADVKVDGKILFVSSKYTQIAAKDTVSITLLEDAMDGEELSLTYIIYK